MRIHDFGSEDREDRRRIEATLEFEAAPRAPFRMFVEATPPLAEALQPIPEPFAAAALGVAAWAGEERLAVDGPLDPTLAAGLEQAGSLYASWFPGLVAPAVEAEGGARPLVPAARRHAAAMCSGGADALLLLRENRRAFPLDHPKSVRTAVYLFGAAVQEYDGSRAVPAHVAAWEVQQRRIRRVCEAIDADLCLAWSNVASLAPDQRVWLDAGFSAAILAVLLAAPGLVTDAHLASSGAGTDSPPHGSHALLDPLWGTSATDVHLGQPLLTRHAKLGRLADWEPAWAAMRVCHDYLRLGEDRVNCGACEKCVRTMTSLLAWGALDRFTCFPYDDVTPEMVEAVRIRTPLTFLPAPDLLAHLERIGRRDLVRAIRDVDARRGETAWGRRRRKALRSLRKRLPRLGRP